jgi:hypothetical protein
MMSEASTERLLSMQRNWAVLLAILLPLPTYAGVLRVPEGHKTIQAAVDAAAPGDTVLLAPGTYTDTVRVTGKEALFIVGEKGREKTIWDGGEKSIPLTATDNKGLLTLHGITFQRGFAVSNGGGFFGEQTPVRIRECRFFSNRADNSGGGLSLMNCREVTVERCVFEGNSCIQEASAISIVGGRGEVAENTVRDNLGGLAVVLIQSACRVRDNVIVRNTCSEFGPLAYQLALSAVIDGNTIAWNSGKEGMGSILLQMGNVRAERNLVCNNSGASGFFVQTEDGLVELAHNNVWENGGGGYIGCDPGREDMALDPLFCNPKDGDYRLRSGSPCLSADEGSVRIGALGEGCP